MKGFFKKLISFCIASLFVLGIAVSKNEGEKTNILEGKKVAIIYFSHNGETYNPDGNIVQEKGNTEVIAEKISKEIKDSKIFKLKVKNDYPKDYDEMTSYVKDQQTKGKLPVLQDSPDIAGYDVIFVGTPVWWGKMSLPVEAFLKSKACKGKIIVPFITHEGSGESGIGDSMKEVSGCKKVLKSLVIKGSEVNKESSDESIKSFLSDIKL